MEDFWFIFLLGYLKGKNSNEYFDENDEFKLHWYMIPIFIAPVLLVIILFAFDYGYI